MPANYCPYCGPFQLCQAGNLDDCYASTDDADEPVELDLEAVDEEPSESQLEARAITIGVPFWERI